MNVKNILVPIDYSDGANAAMAYAVSLAKDYGAELHLVHVHLPVDYLDAGFAGIPVSADLPAVDLKAEEARLKQVTPVGDVKFRHQLILGNPEDELVRYAKENAIDLVIIGSHGRTGLSRLLMGSVAEGVMRHSTCPVLTVKQPADKLRQAE